ncbi:MAG: hypothetical protein J5641_05600 [Bacteroidales bacterium]|nr:hypothetical protein [Bacteroidales bacterium]
MKKAYLIPLLLSLAAFCSCGKKVILDETRTFDRDTWMRFQPEKFEVTPTSTDDCYNFILTLHIDTSHYHETGLPIIMEIESQDHETRTLFSTLLLRSHDGNWLGTFDDRGDLVITQMVRQYFFFSTATTHSVSLGQRTSKYEIHGIRSLNFKIEQAKLEYPE